MKRVIDNNFRSPISFHLLLKSVLRLSQKRTRVFVRSALVLFKIEADLERRRHELATLIQAVYRGHVQYVKYRRVRKAGKRSRANAFCPSLIRNCVICWKTLSPDFWNFYSYIQIQYKILIAGWPEIKVQKIQIDLHVLEI